MPAVPEKLTGRVLADRVLERLRADPAVNADALGVVVVDGELTLSGTVGSLAEKQRVVRAAESVRGIRSVNDRLRVRVDAPHTDRQVTRYVERALATDPVTRSLGIRASTRNGVVTLRGEVPSLAERQLAEAIASEVFAVRAVRNQIEVASAESARAAAEIAEEVRDALAWDARLAGSLVDVRVEEGTVFLEGKVPIAAARRHAIENAWVRGVREVIADALAVEAAGDVVVERTAAVPARSNEELHSAVLRSLRSHPRLRDADITVRIDAGGRVELRGVVESVKAKRTASALVRGRLGLRDVRNRLYVDPLYVSPRSVEPRSVEPRSVDPTEATAPALEMSGGREGAPLEEPRTSLAFDDAELAGELREALRRDAYLSGRRIDVDVDHGQAYLAGEVRSAFERARAEDVVSRLRGITTIHNEIVVERAAFEGEGGGALDAIDKSHLGDTTVFGALYEWSDS